MASFPAPTSDWGSPFGQAALQRPAAATAAPQKMWSPKRRSCQGTKCGDTASALLWRTDPETASAVQSLYTREAMELAMLEDLGFMAAVLPAAGAGARGRLKRRSESDPE